MGYKFEKLTIDNVKLGGEVVLASLYKIRDVKDLAIGKIKKVSMKSKPHTLGIVGVKWENTSVTFSYNPDFLMINTNIKKSRSNNPNQTFKESNL